MRKISPLDRILILLAVLLASYQVVVGIDGLDSFAIISYTIGFGILLVAGLLIIILGFEVLDSPHVAVISTLIPLSLSVGLVDMFFPAYRLGYLVFVLAAFMLVVITRYAFPGGIALGALILAHGTAGLLIFSLPFIFSFQGITPPVFMLVGFGGGLIGIFGVFLSFLKADKPFIAQNRLLAVFPALLLLVALLFTVGFTVV